MAENDTYAESIPVKNTTEALIALADQIDDPRVAALRELHEDVNNVRNCIVHIHNAVYRMEDKKSDPMVNGVIYSIWLDLVELSRITMEVHNK